jgi:hypothetical protein
LWPGFPSPQYSYGAQKWLPRCGTGTVLENLVSLCKGLLSGSDSVDICYALEIHFDKSKEIHKLVINTDFDNYFEIK